MRTHGVASLRLAADTNGKAAIRALAGGPALALPALPFEPPILVQLRAGGGACWEGAYPATAVEQTARTLRARSTAP